MKHNINKEISLLVGISLLLTAICFISYAARHPEATFPWSNSVTFLIYGGCIWLLFKFLLDIPVLQTRRKPSPNRKLSEKTAQKPDLLKNPNLQAEIKTNDSIIGERSIP